MDSSSLKPGITQSFLPDTQKSVSLKSGPTMQGKPNLRGGATKIGGGGLGANKTKLGGGMSKQQTSQKQEAQRYIKEGNIYVTPKSLISPAIESLSQEYQQRISQNQEKDKQEKNQVSASQNESQSIMQSADKSSNSDYKMSSSGIKDSSFQQSQRSENTESEDDSKGKSDPKDEKKKKQKVLTEEEKNEQVIINLSETETQFLFYIPSSLVVSDATHSNKVTQQIIERNQKYERYVQERIGSDNYTSRAANTANLAPKTKEQNSTVIEAKETGFYVANWDLYDAEQQEQLKEYEILQEEIRKNIEKQLKALMREPFCFLPTDVKAIKLHKDVEVPGSQLIYEQAKAKGQKGVGAGSHGNTGAPHGSTQLNAHTSLGDETNKDTSERIDDSGKFGKTGEAKTGGGTKTVYGLTKGETLEQMQKQAQLLQQKVQQEEKKLFQDVMEASFRQPSEEEQLIMSSDKLSTNLKYVDRILNQHTYHSKYILYRNYPEVKIQRLGGDDDKKEKRRQYNKEKQDEEQDQKKQTPLNELFSFRCDLTQNRAVSCADWNPINKDLLAVTYGEYDLNVNKPGYVMFWTLKNPSYPERIIKTNTRIMSCKFSNQNPNLLATGSYDGVVAIYDLRKKDGIPVAENKEHREKHSDVIWEVQWAAKGSKNSDKGEGLVSISADGRVCEWSMKKGLDLMTLMNLKRSSPPGSKDNSSEGNNFREVAGMSMDFLKGESSMYLVATDDGAVHRCSKSYTEQYLDSFFGHSGPVYKVRCNPFNSDIFLTCSADWSCKLWNIKAPEQQNPICNFLSLDLFDEVMDIQWSPHTSTLFASVCKDGRLEIWDIEKNSMDPYDIATKKNQQPASEKTVVRFGVDAPIILTGDVDGDLTVYRLHGYEDQDPNNQVQKLEKVLQQQGYSKGKGDRGQEE